MPSWSGQLAPSFRPWAEWIVDVATRYGLAPVVASAYRSGAKQRQLYSRYLSGQNPYPVARPGTSQHEYGLAIDINLPHPEYLPWLGSVWRSVGGPWSESDPVHFGVPRAS